MLCHRRPRGYPPQPEHDAVEGICVIRVPCIDLKYYKPTWLPMNALRAADVLHVHGIGAPLDAVALLQPLHRRPIVVSTHGGIFHTAILSKLKRWYFQKIVSLSGRRVNQFLATSKNDYRLFEKVSDRVTLLENGVALPAAVQVPRDDRRLLHVGRLAENKQVEKLLQIVAELAAMEAGITLRLVGPDWRGNSARLIALAKSLKVEQAVDFVGEVSGEQLAVEYASAGWLVSASRFEGFGLSLIEGMSAGCVPIVNRIAAFEDIIEYGRNGFLIDFEKTEEAARTIASLLTSGPSQEIASAARATALNYSWDEKAPRFMEIYAAAIRAFRAT